MVLDPDGKLKITTKNGITIRMDVAGIRAAGRSTQGVKLINLGPGDTIGSIERLATIEDAEETGKVGGTSPQPPSFDKLRTGSS